MPRFTTRLSAIIATASLVLAGLTFTAAPANAATAAPAAPTGLTLTPGLNQLSASWTAPTVDGGSPVTGYQVTYSTLSTFQVGAATSTVNVNGTSTTLTGLAGATNYYVKVAAKNAVGTSPNSTTVMKATASAPAAPTAAKGVPGKGSATVTFTAPTATGGIPLSGYKIQYSTDATFATGVTTVPTDTGLSQVVTGLANNTHYNLRVAAVNAAGTGPYSAVFTITTPTTAGAPAAPTLTAGNKSLIVSWKAPSVTGGLTPTGYAVQYSRDATFATGVTTVTTTNVLTTTLTGLTDGATYAVRVAAINPVGTGAYSPSASKTAFAVPGAPTAGIPTAGLFSITAKWTAPKVLGGSPVTGYKVQYSTDSTFATVTGTLDAPSTATSLVIPGLSGGTIYYVRVAATNVIGTGDYINAGSASTFSVPAAPTGMSATSGNATSSLAWKAPATNGGSMTLTYRIQYTTDPAFETGITTVDTTTNAPNKIITGLSNSTVYYYRVAATNAVGTSAYSPIISRSTFTAPNAPTGVTLTPGVAKIAAKWTAPAITGGSPVTGYTVQYSTDSTFATGVATVTVTGNTATLTGLAHSSTYYVRVAATSIIGTGTATANVSATTFTTPAAPTGITLTGGARQIAVAFTAPTVTGGSPVTGYLVQYTTDSTWASGITSVATAKGPYTITGLTTGVTYYVRVKAVTLVGSGTPSTPISATTFNAPAAPATTTMTAGAGTATVTFATPTSTGGSPITGYALEYSTDDTFTTGVLTATAVKSPATITGLAPATKYYVRVKAVTAAGAGTPGPVANATTFPLPATPTALTITTGTTVGTLGVKWTNPTSTGGTPITGTAVQYSRDSTFATGVTTVTTTSTATSSTLSGLINGATYYVRVATKTAAGQGSYTTPVSATTLGVPSTPRALAVTPALNSLAVSWTVPASTGGTPITGYQVMYSSNEDMSAATVREVSGATSTSYTLSGLNGGETYYVAVVARNLVGASNTATATAVPEIAMPAPNSLTVTAGSSSTATATWSAPTAPGTPAIAGYTLQYSTSDTFATGVTTVSVTDPTYAASTLDPATTYYFRAAALGSTGPGAYSDTVSVLTPPAYAVPGTPGTPTATLIEAGNGITATWTAPASAEGTVTYTLQYATDADFTTGVNTVTGITGTTHTLTDLALGSPYYLRVKASNESGSSDYTVATPTEVSLFAGQLGYVAYYGNGTTYLLGPGNSSLLPSTSVPVGARITVTADGTTYTGTTTAVTRKGDINFTIAWDVEPALYFTTYSATATIDASVLANRAVTLTTPSKPAYVSAYNSSTELGAVNMNLGMGSVQNDGGKPVISYTIQYSTDPTFETGVTTLTTTSSWATITGLAQGTTYSFRFLATNPLGDGPYSDPFSLLTDSLGVPSEPYLASIFQPGASSLPVTFYKPAEHGAPITSYTLQYSADATLATGVTTVSVDPAGSATNYTITGLTSGTYYVRVAAVNSQGTSTWSNVQSATTAASAPDAPNGVSATATGVSTATVTWGAPISDGGSPITTYYVTARDSMGNWRNIGSVQGTSTDVSGLSAGESYTFYVTATNQWGTSSATASQPTRIATAPGIAGTPQLVAASPTSLTATWNDAPNNGSLIFGYTIQYSTDKTFATGVTTLDKPGVAASATLTGLITGETYYVRVAATNAYGTAAYSETGSGVPADAPGPVTALSATMNELGTADLTWTAPAYDGGTPVTSYTVTATQFPFSGQTITVTGTTAHVTGLILGLDATFTVKAFNAVGISAGVTSDPILIAAAPSTPTMLPAYANYSLASMSWYWNSATNNGSAITGYTLQYSADATFATGVTTVAVEPGQYPTIDGLTAGVTYYARVSATNALGTSAYSSSISEFLPGAPSAPDAPTLTAGAADAPWAPGFTVAWTAPATNGGTINHYDLQYSTDKTFTTNVTTREWVESGQSYAYGLTAGATYYARVRAVSEYGTGAWSGMNSVLAAATPDAPTALNAAVTATGTGITATWTAPASDGGAAISYTLDYSTDSTFATGVTTVTGLTATSYTIDGLTTATTYYVRVKSVNVAGSSAYLAPAQTTTSYFTGTADYLDFWGSGTSTLSSQNAALAFASVPAGARITVVATASNTTYTGTFTDSASSGDTALAIAWDTNPSWIVESNTDYPMSVTIERTALSGSATTWTVPGTPTWASSPYLTSTTSAWLDWTTPTSGGTAITGYTLTATPVGGGTPITVTTGNTDATVTGLTTGQSYMFAVTATNLMGTGPALTSASTLIATEPSQPNAPVVFVSTLGTADIYWGAPAANGSPITGYTVYASNGSTCTSTTTSCSISGLTTGTTYTYKVQAVNAIGGSWLSNASAASLMALAPNTPTVTGIINNGSGSFSMSWSAPANNGSAITGYTVRYSTNNGSTWATQSLASTATSATITGLPAGATVYATVSATNAAGTSAPSSSRSMVLQGNVLGGANNGNVNGYFSTKSGYTLNLQATSINYLGNGQSQICFSIYMQWMTGATTVYNTGSGIRWYLYTASGSQITTGTSTYDFRGTGWGTVRTLAQPVCVSYTGASGLSGFYAYASDANMGSTTTAANWYALPY